MIENRQRRQVRKHDRFLLLDGLLHRLWPDKALRGQEWLGREAGRAEKNGKTPP
jgi:hypothetical protein